MQNSYSEDEYFLSVDFNKHPVANGEYDNCTFENCNFRDFNLSDFNFEECIFKNCELSNAKIANTAFKTVLFENCKLIGLQFNECNSFLLAFKFIDCQLNLSSFYRLKLENTIFKDCSLPEVDFSETDLSESTFSNCNFLGAMFGNTNLEKTDFSSSSDFLIDPENNRIKGAKFTLTGLPGLLNKYQIKVI